MSHESGIKNSCKLNNVKQNNVKYMSKIANLDISIQNILIFSTFHYDIIMENMV